MRALALALVILGGCGPIAYVNDVTRKASDAVAEARAAEADKYALYHWTRAVEYLRQARTIAAHADYQAANRFGRLATEAAELATQEANAAKKDPSKVKGKKPDDVAPAKGGDDEAPPPKSDDKKKIAPAKDSP
jgi:sRNA-binding protein